MGPGWAIDGPPTAARSGMSQNTRKMKQISMPDIALPPNNPPSLKALDTLEMEGGKGRGAGRKGRNGRKERKEWNEGKEGRKGRKERNGRKERKDAGVRLKVPEFIPIR